MNDLKIRMWMVIILYQVNTRETSNRLPDWMIKIPGSSPVFCPPFPSVRLSACQWSLQLSVALSSISQVGRKYRGCNTFVDFSASIG